MDGDGDGEGGPEGDEPEDGEGGQVIYAQRPESEGLGQEDEKETGGCDGEKGFGQNEMPFVGAVIEDQCYGQGCDGREDVG